LDFKLALLGEADLNSQWAMIGLIGIIFVLLPETPWWLASKGKLDKAARVLEICNGDVEGYDVQEQIVGLPLNST
jgi:MFS transporter, SP family, general alpha glucoside:H+ symporter